MNHLFVFNDLIFAEAFVKSCGMGRLFVVKVIV